MENEILKMRKSLGLTQKDFSELIGITECYLSLVERGKRQFSPHLKKFVEEKVKERLILQSKLKPGEELPPIEPPDIIMGYGQSHKEDTQSPKIEALEVIEDVQQRSANIEKVVSDNNDVLVKVVEKLSGFKKQLSALEMLEDAIETRIRQVTNQQSTELLNAYRHHIASHAYVIHSTLSMIVTMLDDPALFKRHRPKLIEMINNSIKRLDEMMQ